MNAIDRYLPLELLGRGGFGAVYRARHVHTGELVALKVFDPDLGAEGLSHRVLREARALAGLIHPNVVRVLDCGVAATGEVFVAMELAHGLELAKLLEAGPLPLSPHRAIAIAQQVLAALAAVHARGIVHRDIKPSNIVVATEALPDGSLRDHVRVIDFGISKVVGGETAMPDRTRPGTSMGTPGYMAPEQLGSAHAADARADLYAVAVILYQMLSGVLPHRAPTYEDYVVAVRTTPPPPLSVVAPHVPRALEALVMRGLQRDPRARYQSAVEFASALAAAIDAAVISQAPTMRAADPPAFGTPTSGTSGGPTPPPTVEPTHARTQASAPWPWVAVGAALLLALVGGSGTVWVVSARSSTTPASTPSPAPSNEEMVRASTSVRAPSGVEAAEAVAPTVPAPVALAKPIASSTSTRPCGKGGTLPVVVASSPGVKIGPGRVVGAADAAWMDAVATHGARSVGVCRPECGSELVTVHLFLQTTGKLGLVGPSPDNTGNEAVARCVADHIKSGAPLHGPNLPSSPTGAPHGIVTYSALLEQK